MIFQWNLSSSVDFKYEVFDILDEVLDEASWTNSFFNLYVYNFIMEIILI